MSARTVTLSQHHAAAPDVVWEMVTSYARLAEVNAPLVTMPNLPAGHVSAGDVIETEPKLFGLLPLGPYRMEVTACDPAALRFESAEHGGGVERFEHRLQLHPEGEGTRVDEAITLDAGPRTALVAAWVRMLYRHRHRRRTALLAATEGTR